MENQIEKSNVSMEMPPELQDNYAELVMGGLDEGSGYIVLKRVGPDIHWAARFFTGVTPDGEMSYGAKIRLAYNDFYDGTIDVETLNKMDSEQQKFRSVSLLEITKQMIPWTSVNAVRCRLVVGEETAPYKGDFPAMAKRFIDNFESLSAETVDDKMLVMVAIKDTLEYQAKQVEVE